MLIMEGEAKAPVVRALPKVVGGVWGRVGQNTGFLGQNSVSGSPNPTLYPQIASVPGSAVS